jgi:RNA methyltransferase, TrmH family
VITSNQNPLVRQIRSLVSSAQERRSGRVFVLEGVRLVTDALAAGAAAQHILYAADQLAASAAGRDLLRRLLTLPQAQPASESAVAAASDTRQPQGVVAVVEQPQLAVRPGLRLVLDGIQDPGNLGTLLRSAAAVGAGLVITTAGSCDAFSPKVARAAMGAHFLVPLRSDVAYADLPALTDTAGRVFAASGDGALDYDLVDWRRPATLIIGNEAHGLSREALAWADAQVAIPLPGGMESLNAAVAGSIMLFEALRQQRRAAVQ